MRLFATTAGLLAPAAALAGEGFLGTKTSPMAGPMQADAGGAGFMPFLQMMIALGIVLAMLKVVLPKLASKLNKKLVTKVGGGIRIEESANFAGGSLYIVSARDKTLLLSVAPSGVNCLADLTHSTPVDERPAFQELVEKEMTGPMQPFAVVDAAGFKDHQPTPADAKAALERLNRLSG